MSADSPRRVGNHRGAQVVSPQPVSEGSIIESMAGIINDIVPQAYTGSGSNSDNREVITWARFEYADVNDMSYYPDYNEGSSIPPLLLVLGYNTGVQIWLIPASGEAIEVLSWRQGQVRTLRVLPSPRSKNNEREDPYKLRRPMVAMCDSAGPGPHFCSVSFLSLKTGEQVKSIKFKSPVCDVLANKRSIVVTFSEKIAVFDAKTLEDVLTITTCYPSPGPNSNPVALGTRWLAYSEKKLIPGKRSSGGSEGEGVSSYTATVLYAAKSLGKGLRGLGETVASSLTGNSVSPMANINNSHATDISQPGVVTVIDLQAAKDEKDRGDTGNETIVAHFTAHNDAIVAMTFDRSGALLLTADKQGHDFHVFRIQPHPGGPSLAAVHHLYVLHRGDTTAKVQDMTFSLDARWAAISTLRGTTHVFPVAPYGGLVGVRTHSLPYVVNRQSRFHKSAGLSDDGARSNSPVSHAELSVYPYTNPRLPPYPHPTIIHPLAQLRQPSAVHTTAQPQNRSQQRQRLQSDDSVNSTIKICACFAPPRAWINTQRDATNLLTKRAVDSLFIMACHGNMIQYDLEPKPSAHVPKEKVCDDTPIELETEAKGQWTLMRSPLSPDVLPPLPSTSPLLNVNAAPVNNQQFNNNESRWLSQVEIFTHAGPHRRLWMGPQFVFKTYNAPSGVAANLVEAETVEVGLASGSRPARSNPVNMPHSGSRPLVPVVIDGSGSSFEQSPRTVEIYSEAMDHVSPSANVTGENQLQEDLAEAMLETPHRSAVMRTSNDQQYNTTLENHRVIGQPVAKVVNPLGTVVTLSAAEEDDLTSPIVQQDQDIADDLVSSTSSSATTATSSAVCAQEGKYPQPQEQPEGQYLKDNTSICAEMRPADEPAFIDTIPDDTIVELKEKRQLCAEAAPTSDYYCALDLDRIGAFKDVPSSPMLCVEKGAVPDCSNVIQSSVALRTKIVEAEVQNMGYQVLEVTNQLQDNNVAAKGCTSSDDDIEHVTTEELAIPTKPLPTGVLSSDDDLEHIRHSDVPSNRKRSKDKFSPAPEIVKESTPERQKEVTAHQQKQRKQKQQRNKRQQSSDMVEIINLDAIPTVEVKAQKPEIIDPPVSPQKAEIEETSDMVEIIDIDAEKSSGNFAPQVIPECKILLPARPDNFGKKKNKRQRKQKEFFENMEQAENLRADKTPDKEVEVSHTQQTGGSWSSMVRRRSGSTPKTEESPAVPSNIEVEKVVSEKLEEDVDEVEANKENVDLENTQEIIKVELLPKKEETEDTQVTVQAQTEEEPIEKKSDSEQDGKGTLDDVVVPMDFTEQPLLDKNEVAVIVETDDDITKQLPTCTALPSKKANRSKKKKRR